MFKYIKINIEHTNKLKKEDNRNPKRTIEIDIINISVDAPQ